MRHVPTVVATVALSACVGGDAPLVTPGGRPTPRDLPPPPPAPASRPSGEGIIWTLVVDRTGLCVEGAVTEIVAGPGTGRRAVQETPCDAWAYYGGAMFGGLAPDTAVTLRASAPRYAARDTMVVPAVRSFRATVIGLDPH